MTKSLGICHDALAAFKEINHLPGIGDQLTDIAYLYAMKGNMIAALDWYKRAMPFYDEAGEKDKANMTKKNIESIEKKGM